MKRQFEKVNRDLILCERLLNVIEWHVMTFGVSAAAKNFLQELRVIVDKNLGERESFDLKASSRWLATSSKLRNVEIESDVTEHIPVGVPNFNTGPAGGNLPFVTQ